MKRIWSKKNYRDYIAMELTTCFKKAIAMIGLYDLYCRDTGAVKAFITYLNVNDAQLSTDAMVTRGIRVLFTENEGNSALRSRRSARRMIVKKEGRPIVVYDSLPALVNCCISYISKVDPLKRAFCTYILSTCEFIQNYIITNEYLPYDNCLRKLLDVIYEFLKNTKMYGETPKRRTFAQRVLDQLGSSDAIKNMRSYCPGHCIVK